MRWPLLLLLISNFAYADTTLIDVLKTAEQSSPRLQSARQHGAALQENIRVQKSSYLPDVNLAVAASTGHPGSFSMLDVDSDLSSTNRTGEGGALVLKQDIWDFGRTSANVHAAETESKLQGQEVVVDRARVDQEVLKTYLDCSYLKTQVGTAKFIAQEAREISKQIQGFVRSGQRSIIERDLVEAEVKEDDTRIAEFTERIHNVELRLAIEAGMASGQRIVCSALEDTASQVTKLLDLKGDNPLVAAQNLRVDVAQSHLDRARADARPVFVGMATGGYFDNPNLVNKVNYAAGVGVTVPLFAGFRIEASVGRESADLQAESSQLSLTRQVVDKANSEYDEQVKSLQVRLEFLKKEQILAQDVFKLARKRYFSSQGTLLDLREAIKNYTRVLQTTNETTRDLLLSRGEQSFFNGGHITE